MKTVFQVTSEVSKTASHCFDELLYCMCCNDSWESLWRNACQNIDFAIFSRTD